MDCPVQMTRATHKGGAPLNIPEEGQPLFLGRTSIVNEDVNGPILLDSGLHTSARKIFCSDIASKGDSVASLRLDLLGYLQGHR
jgi:hypothetical protein